ncbi:MAG: nucleoside deaminase [Devosiaceae bacterium]|nr:nucleoside deaminase [Devosiaceae bacterium]
MKKTIITRLLDVMASDIAPMTAQEVLRGNKIFGAAILLKSDLSLVIAETNNEIENPLWHGEMHAIKKLYERNRASLPEPKDCIFLSTHEPCSLCLSAIAWAGYDNFYYLFSHEDSRDNFAIPHDLQILKEVFNLDSGEYSKDNAFWKSHNLTHMIAELAPDDREELETKVIRLRQTYAALSETYQTHKGDAGIPLA